MKITTFNVLDTFSYDGNLNMKSGVYAVDQCMSTLLQTPEGELRGDPAFGSLLRQYLHYQNSAILQDFVRDNILSQASRYDHRITINNNNINISKSEAVMNIAIQYYIQSQFANLSEFTITEG